jgi:hypothetical protein
VRARGRGGEVVRRAHPVDDTARLNIDVGSTARLPLKNAVRARGRGGEVVRRAHPVDDTARLDLNVDDTARLPTVAVKPSVPRAPR